MDGTVPLFRMEGISKRYGGVRALEKAELSVVPGRIHAILGENGAGKSTLIKIMAGVVAPDEGRMTMEGQEVNFASPAAANHSRHRLHLPGTVADPRTQRRRQYRHLRSAEAFRHDRPASAAQNRRGSAGARRRRRHPSAALVKDLPLSRRQMVEIAKALARKPRILILDEATSALTAADVAKIFAVLKRLRSEGLALLYISHRMNEIAELADECTVFRNGRNVATYTAGTKSDNEVVEMMIGREYSHVFPPKPQRTQLPGRRCWSAATCPGPTGCNDISLTVRAGEVVGLGGLDGQGQRELLLAFFGVLRSLSGQVLIDGKPVSIASPAAARKNRIGMALIPEDRKTEGLMLPMTVRENLSFAALDRVSRGGVIDRAAEQRLIDEMVKLLAIKTAGLDIPVGALSGGNQQKVVIAKWLMRQPRIILLNDPTRGIDVGTKQEMYQLLRKLADAGAAILFYSTDYDELIGCCDRVLVLYDGAIKRELAGAELTERALIASALNIHGDAAGMRQEVNA